MNFALPPILYADVAPAPSPKRELPDYDNRGPEPTTAGDVLIWIPRILFAPIYFVTEYVLRWPLGVGISAAERSDLPREIYDFFIFGPDHKAGIAPIGFIDFGFNPSVGIFAFWDDAFEKGHNIRFHGTAWTGGWLAGVLQDRIPIGAKDSLNLNFVGIRRPDYVFYGIGPRTREGYKSRYGEDRLEANALFDIPLWRESRIQASSGIRDASIYHGHFSGDPSLEVHAARGVFPIPYGFGRGYTAQTNSLLAAFDTRVPRPAPGSGVRIEASGEQGSDVRRTPDSGWIRYGASAAGFLDLDGHNRVLSLSVTAKFVDPLGHSPIPFTELVSLGGNEPMRGFYPGRLVDRSATTATLHYRWPIWVWLDGSLQAAVGNVFGDHLDGWKASLMRFSGAVGIESVGTPDNSLEVLLGMGSETLRLAQKSTRSAFKWGPIVASRQSHLLIAALTLTACAGVRPFPLKAPLARDTDLNPIVVGCHKEAVQEGQKPYLLRTGGVRVAARMGRNRQLDLPPAESRLRGRSAR